jgi:uncharacterized repeat protein (TIGR04138 family)
MESLDFGVVLDEIVAQDGRYHRDAYVFLREALDYTQRTIRRASKEKLRHVTGQELLEGIRAYALDQYGPMTLEVLGEWGVRRCEDFGEMVFTLVERKVLSKTEQDSRTDFEGGYDFEAAFRKPFLPSRRGDTPAAEPQSASG